MESVGLHSLPVELLHHISGYLAVEDIVSCSKTCHWLRTVFNDNVVWKRFLPDSDFLNLKSEDDYLEPLQPANSPLTPLCENRIHYVTKGHLLNKWKQESFKKYSVNVRGESYAQGVFNTLKGIGQVIFQDRYLFLGHYINDCHSDGIHVWDLKETPVLYTKFDIEYKNYDSFCIVGSNLVVIYCFRVDVYEITLPQNHFPLLYSFLITEEDVTFGQAVFHSGRHDMRCTGWSHAFVGHYLISNKCGEDIGSVFHIWDIFNAAKAGSFCSPFEIVGVDCFSVTVYSHVQMECFFKQTTQPITDTYYFTFNIEEKKFSDFVFKCVGYASHIIYYKPHIIVFKNADEPNSDGWYDSVCTVYDFKTSKELNRRRFNNAHKNYTLECTNIVNGKFVLLCIDYFEVVDASTLETVNTIQCGDISYITKQVNIFGSVFVLACTKDYKLEMWNVTMKKKWSRFPKNAYACHLFISDTFKTMAYMANYETIDVLYFM